MRITSLKRTALMIAAAAQLCGASVVSAQCTQCVGDANADGEVTIDEIIQAVNNALEGCDRPPTPTRTPTVLRTATATATATSSEPCAVTPGAWSAPAFAANAAQALALRAQLNTLTGNATMRGAELGTVVLGGVAHLQAEYTAGSPSLAGATTPAFDALLADVFAEFAAVIEAGSGDPINGSGQWTPAVNGGLFGNSPRGMNAGGIEVRQIADKGLFGGAAMYHYARSLTEGPIIPATIDALAAAWGANEVLDPATLTQSANYSRLMGFYARMTAALAEAKAFAASNACGAQRDAAIRSFFHLWEESMFARVVFYANLGSTLVAAATTDNDKIEALHQISEGIGLALGFRGMPLAQSGPLAGLPLSITDAQINQIASALRVNAADLNASTTGTFVQDLNGLMAAVVGVEQVVAVAYGLDAAQIAFYRNPTAG